MKELRDLLAEYRLMSANDGIPLDHLSDEELAERLGEIIKGPLAPALADLTRPRPTINTDKKRIN